MKNTSLRISLGFVSLIGLCVLYLSSCKTTDSMDRHQDAQVNFIDPTVPVGQSLPKDARVFFTNLKEKQVIPQSYLLKFNVVGMTIHPAGELISGTGHHHLIIDGISIGRGQVVPTDKRHIHFGKGQSEYLLKLEPGQYTLTLQFADGAHISYGEQMSSSVNITVK